MRRRNSSSASAPRSASTSRCTPSSSPGSDKLLHGDLGVSLISNVPVLKMISQRVEPSISIALSTIILAILVAVPLGVIAAWKHGTWIDRFVMGLSVVGFSVPVFVIGYVLIQVFAIDLRWVPVQGFRSIIGGLRPVLRAHHPADLHAVLHLCRADRAHDARGDAGRARRGLRPHRARQGHQREPACCCAMRCATPRCPSSP